jgi:hypothetical protein
MPISLSGRERNPPLLTSRRSAVSFAYARLAQPQLQFMLKTAAAANVAVAAVRHEIDGRRCWRDDDGRRLNLSPAIVCQSAAFQRQGRHNPCVRSSGLQKNSTHCETLL